MYYKSSKWGGIYNMKYEIIFKFMSRIGVLLYLLVTTFNSYIFMVEDNYNLLVFDEISISLHIAFVISIITAIFICTTSHRYIISFILIVLSSMFLVMCLCTIFGMPNLWGGDGIKIASYILISNLIIIVSIISSYKNCTKSKKLNTM